MKTINKYLKHTCKYCGSERKYVETIIDDEFIWDERSEQYVPNGYADEFDHSGNNRCAECDKEWTGW